MHLVFPISWLICCTYWNFYNNMRPSQSATVYEQDLWRPRIPQEWVKFDLHTRIAPRKAVCGLVSKNGMPQLVARNNSLTFGRGLYLKGLLSRKISVFKRESRAWIQTECISRTRIPPRFNLPWLISVDGICSTFVAWSHRSMVDIMTGNKFQLKNDVNLPP